MDTDRMLHLFSIEMKSKKFVKQVTLSNESRDGVYFEGFLGDILEICFVNGGMLEIRGVNGTFRIDINKEKVMEMLVTESD